MNKQRLLIVIGLLLAIGSAWAMKNYAAEIDKKVPVVVAKKTIALTDKLSADNLEVVQLPPRYILPGAYTALEQVAGKQSGTTIYQGEQIIQEKISPGQVALSGNERLLFIPCKTVMMKPGQKVDVYVVYQPGKSAKTGSLVLLRAKVIANVLDERGSNLYTSSNEKIDTNRGQSGIEIIVSEEEVTNYLNELVFAQETVVRYGEGVIK